MTSYESIVRVLNQCVLMSLQTPRRSRSLSPVPTSRLNVPRRIHSLDRVRDNDDWIFGPAIDQILNENSKRLHNQAFSDDDTQYGGGSATTHLLDFELRPVGARRNRRHVVNQRRYKATLKQHRDMTARDNLGQELTNALQRSIQRHIDQDPSLTPHSTVHFTMQSSAFTHSFQSATFSVREFQERSQRLDTYLQSLAAKLNSNQVFTPDNTFTMETTFIQTPGPGKRYRPSKAAIWGIVKRWRMTIKNKDQLCCARAIVTMKARVDGGLTDADYKNMLRGRPIQTSRAKELHNLANVPEGPCSLKEIDMFQAALLGYQIKVLSINLPHMIIYAGPVDLDKRILLIKEDGHYNGCNSFSGFLSKSYFCHECNHGYDHDHSENHPCNGKWCPVCKRLDCPDYIKAKETDKFPRPSKPHRTLCHRAFFGDQCYISHLLRRGLNTKSVCNTHKKCPDCCHVYQLDDKVCRSGSHHGAPQHVCGQGECRICSKQVILSSQKCFIQCIREEKDQPKTKRVHRDQVKDHPFREPSAHNPDHVVVDRDPPLQVYADYEATVDQEGVQSPILL